MLQNAVSAEQQTEIPPTKINDGSFKLGSEKIIGYVLLLVGLLMIFGATYSVFSVLTGKAIPPKVFDVEAPSFQLPTESAPSIEMPEGASLPAGLKINQGPSRNAPSVKLIPDEVFNGVLNIGLFYLAMMFLASSGLKVSEIGVKLIKDIKVQIKEDKTKT